MLSRQAVEEFKQICEAEFGMTVSDEFALQQGINLLTLINHVYRPIRQQWQDEFQSDIDPP